MAQNGGSAKRVKFSDELAKFDDVFPLLMNDLEKFSVKDPETSDAVSWFKDVSLITTFSFSCVKRIF